MALAIAPNKSEVIAGDAWSQAFRVRPSADADPEDLTPWTEWSSQWRVTPGATEFIELTVDTSDAANGVITVSADEEQTRAMAGDGVFDVQAALPQVRTFYFQKTKWRLDVTR